MGKRERCVARSQKVWNVSEMTNAEKPDMRQKSVDRPLYR